VSRRLGLQLIALALPLALLAPVSAHAEKVVTEDSVGDVQLVRSFVPEVGSPVVSAAPAPDETAVDITRTVVAHGHNRLSITVHFRDLVLTSVHDTYVRLATPRGRQYAVLVGKNPGFRAKALLLRRGLETDCRVVRAAADGAADTVSVSLPTACLGVPPWVRVGVGVSRVAEVADAYADPTGIALFADDGNRDVVRENSLGFGPKVHRG
jgi:hypothetical protein